MIIPSGLTPKNPPQGPTTAIVLHVKWDDFKILTVNNGESKMLLVILV